MFVADGSMSDADLSRRCRRGDPAAWRLLVRRTSPTAYRVAVRMLGAGGDADDACQEVFVRVHRSFHTYDPTRPLRPWVARIAYNVCLRQLGSAARRYTDATDPVALQDAPEPSPSDPERRFAAREAGEIVWGALEGLSAQDRVLVTLRYQDGLSQAEVAEAMDVPVNTVKSRLHRARARLRAALAPRLEEVVP